MKAVIFVLGVFLIGTQALSEDCSTNSNCTSNNAVCLNNKCQCGSLTYEKDDKCLSYATEYRSYCIETDQCKWLGDNSECSNNRCICSEGYRWFQGICQKYANKGEHCDENTKCYNGYDLLSLSCDEISGTCECAEGFYQRDGGDCRSTSTDSCAMDSDCEKIFSAKVCKLGKCVSPNTEVEVIHYYNIDIKEETIRDDILYESGETSCKKDSDCTEKKNSICLKEKCVKLDSYYFFNSDTNEYVKGFGSCVQDEDCAAFDNTVCFESSCLCLQGFFYVPDTANASAIGSCQAELGTPNPHITISSDSDCFIKPGQKYDDHTCVCKTYWFNDDSNRECIKTTLQDTMSCLENTWCRALGPYAFCNSSGLCECNSFAEFNQDTFYCDMKSTPNVPLSDLDCGYNEKCQNEQCVCAEGFGRDSTGTCLPIIGGSCLIESCDSIANSDCSGGVCICEDDFVNDVTVCRKMADKLGDPCNINEQCSNFEHSICSNTSANVEELECTCEISFNNIDGKCWKKKEYGDICSTKLDCTMGLDESTVCRNSLCQCPIEQKFEDGQCSMGHILKNSYTLTLVLVVWIVGQFD